MSFVTEAPHSHNVVQLASLATVQGMTFRVNSVDTLFPNVDISNVRKLTGVIAQKDSQFFR